MGILDNDTVIVDAILTKIGRQKLANGQPLGITRYCFGDTGVDYTLYNPNHPSGSDSYGSAITNLPMLEAVPDDNVFLRSKLWGTGERNIQNFSFIIVENTSVTITKVPRETESNPVIISPTVFPREAGATFDFLCLDIRGLTFGGANVDSDVPSPDFDYPDPVSGRITGVSSLTVNAKPQQITSQKSVGLEITKAGAGGARNVGGGTGANAAPAFVTITANTNNTTG
tara:strand:- start:634 stop:1317 length:684 start_codon:yes stop_codon:yes gene_type:complete